MEQKTPEKKNTAGRLLRSGKFRRGGMAALLSLVFIAVVVVLNILVGMLTERFPSMNIDLTAQKLHSLSDQALEVAHGVQKDTRIYLIGSEDAYWSDTIFSSYGLKYSQVASLAEKLREANSKISVQFIDPDTNPTFISRYPDEVLATGRVLVETDQRHKVLTANDMFEVATNQTTGAQESYSIVDSALAAALEMVNLDKVPVLTLVTGHDEMLSRTLLTGFEQELESQNFEIREVNLLTGEIPEETQVLMLATPQTDYAAEELDKLRAFLDDTTRQDPLCVMVTCHPTQSPLPNLARFLEEWGVRVEGGTVAETDSSRFALGSRAFVIADPSADVLVDKTYNSLVVPFSSPLKVLFSANDGITTWPLWTTADSAYISTADISEEDLDNVDTGVQTLATLSTRQVRAGSTQVARSVVVFGSSMTFTDTLITASAFGNRSYISDLMLYATGTDGASVTVSTSRVQTNALDVTASAATIFFLGLGLFTLGIPLIILIAGLVVFLRRRHL